MSIRIVYHYVELVHDSDLAEPGQHLVSSVTQTAQLGKHFADPTTQDSVASSQELRNAQQQRSRTPKHEGIPGQGRQGHILTFPGF